MGTLKRIHRFVLLVRVILNRAIRGRADKAPKQINTIIVVATGKLGDIVCCTPVLAAIRTYKPLAKIIVAGPTKLQKSILADSNLVDEYLNLEGVDVIKRIKAVHADAALVTGPSYFALALLYISGIPLVVGPHVSGGFSPSVTRPYRILEKYITTYPYRFGEYAPRERLGCLLPIGIETEITKKSLGFSETAKGGVDHFFNKHKISPKSSFIVAISPSAGNKIKEWPEERFAKVADFLYSTYKATIFIIGGPSDTEQVSSVISKAEFGSNFIPVTEFSIDELKAFMSQIHLFVSVDTGPIYIAEAFGVPTVDITGPIDEREQPPIGLRHKIVTPPQPRKPELFVLNARAYNYDEAMRQNNSITVQMVTAAIDEIMQEIQHERK